MLQLGMGPDGHTASLFPHTEALHETSRLVTANHVETVKDSWRMTLTQPVINDAAEVFFLIGGQDKAQILKEVLLGPRDPERLPSQLICACERYTYIAPGHGCGGVAASDWRGCDGQY